MRKRFHVAALAVLCAALFLPALGKGVVGFRKETRVVLPARVMAEGGSWLVPVYQGELRLRKPPLMYWIVAGAFRAAGTTESAFVARIPSAAMAAALVLGLYAAGSRWIGRRRAFYGAGVAASSLLFMRHARLASPEAALGLFVLLAAWSGYEALTGCRRTQGWIGFGVFAGLGFLVKGPAGIALPGAAVLAFALGRRAERARLRDWRLVLALACFALVGLPWYVALRFAPIREAADAAIGSELSETLLGTDHGGGLLYYVYQLPGALMPWGVLLPFGVWALWRARRHRGVRFLLGWLLTAFAILSAVGNKQIHYTLLLVPQGALAAGYLLGFAESRASSWRRSLARGYLSGLLGVAALGGVALAVAPFAYAGLPRLGLGVAGAVMLAVAAAGGLAVRRAPAGAMAGAIAVWAAVAIGTHAYESRIQPERAADTVIVDFARAARTRIPEGAAIFFPERLHAPIVEFYLHRRLSVQPSLYRCRALARPGDALVIVEDRKHQYRLLPPLPALDMRKRDVRCRLFILDSADGWTRGEGGSVIGAGAR